MHSNLNSNNTLRVESMIPKYRLLIDSLTGEIGSENNVAAATSVHSSGTMRDVGSERAYVHKEESPRCLCSLT